VVYAISKKAVRQRRELGTCATDEKCAREKVSLFCRDLWRRGVSANAHYEPGHSPIASDAPT
jgi:hypothetical protein